MRVAPGLHAAAAPRLRASSEHAARLAPCPQTAPLPLPHSLFEAEGALMGLHPQQAVQHLVLSLHQRLREWGDRGTRRTLI